MRRITRLFLYGISTSIVILLLVAALNLVFFCYNFYVFYKADANYISGGDIMKELTFVEGKGYVLSGGMRKRLSRENQWAMLLNEKGEVVWSEKKPAEVGTGFTQADIARMTRWYLEGYPVRLRVWEDRIMVVGLPRDVMWKYTVELPLSVVMGYADALERDGTLGGEARQQAAFAASPSKFDSKQREA